MSLKTKKEKKNKEEKKKLSFRRSLSNIFFAFREIQEGSPVVLWMYTGITVLYAPLDFLYGSFLIRMIVNGVEKGTPARVIVTYMVILAVATLLIDMASSFFWNIISPVCYRKVGASIQKKLFRKAAQVELACYETPTFYDKYVKAMDQAFNRVMDVLHTTRNLLWRLVTLACNSFLLFLIDPWLIVFGLFPLVLGLARRRNQTLSHELTVTQKPIDRRVEYVRRVFYLNEYAKEIRIGGMYVRMFDEVRHIYRDFKAVMRRYGLRRAILSFIESAGLEVVTILGSMLYAVWRTLGDGSMSIGDCVVILNSIGTISYSLNSMVQTAAEFTGHALFLEDMRYFLDYEPAMAEDENAPPARVGDLVMEDVSFRYEGAEEDTLKHISLRIRPGERIALVGQNGSGKTTLVKLLLRLYDPTAGAVKLDGQDVREYRLSSFRDQFSCVFQDFKLFSASVRENVLLRRCGPEDDEAVTAALKESGAYERVMKLEGGLDATLTREFAENGANLSVGEAQKLSLARVFAEDSPFIILDEPSSALDPLAEHAMFENMMRAARGRTVIFLSHRLSSAVDADRIYMMEGGRLVEVGTHRELMAKGGKYADMFHRQAANYVGEEAHTA